MKSWFVSRWRVVFAASLSAILVLTIGAVWALQLQVAKPTVALECSTLEATDFADAGVLASACSENVEVVGERTPWQTVWATSKNTTRVEISAEPVRVDAGGAWGELDTEIVTNAEKGTLSVAAPVYPIELNAGGAAGHGDPLGSITRDGKRLDVWFPLELPVPETDGAQATYEFGDGIRLIVSVSVDGTGFLPVIELANPAAAARFIVLLEAARANGESSAEGIDVDFTTQISDGLELSDGEEGVVNVIDAEGEIHFMATPPIMWDSSGGDTSIPDSATEVGETDRTRSPADGDQLAMMDVDISGQSIIVSPDEDMLASPETTWPVYIDPEFSGKGPAEWVAVRSGGYTGTLYKWGDISASAQGQGMGYCSVTSSCVTQFKQRLAWEFTGLNVIENLDAADISSAEFSVSGVHAYTCTPTRTDIYRTSTLTTGTTWSNLSWASPSLGQRTETHSASCGGRGFRDFDVTSGIKWAAENDKTSFSVGLKANDESTMTGWKRFRHTATLAVEYNRIPNVPTLPHLSSPYEPLCTSGSDRPVIATKTPVLSAKSSDPDGTNVRTAFIVSTTTSPAVQVWSSGNLPGQESGEFALAAVPAGLLDDEQTYSWTARAWDGLDVSLWSTPCQFTVDVSKPAGPIVQAIAGVAETDAKYKPNVDSGGVGQQGAFEIDRGTRPDATSFVYGFNSPVLNLTATPGTNGKATITFTPTTTGPVVLTVKSQDAAGNQSLSTNYAFGVASPAEDALWALDEGFGLTAADSHGAEVSLLRLTGALWGDGPHALFQSRAGDHALVFDGVNDYAATDAPVVNTLESFVVSAHVKLDAGTTGQGHSFTALAQDGIQDGIEGSGFRLGYSATCPGVSTGCWTFVLPGDAAGSSASAARSAGSVKTGEWTHLVGEYDKSQAKVRLWVCDIGTPTAPAIGEPLRSEANYTGSPWSASGAFTVGRGLAAGASTNFWPGAIDNIRVYSGDIVAESKIRRLCQGAEASAFTNGNDELDPTTEVE